MTGTFFIHLGNFEGLPSQSEAISRWVLFAVAEQQKEKDHRIREADVQSCLNELACLGVPLSLSLIDIQAAVKKLIVEGFIERCGKNSRYICLTEKGFRYIDELRSDTALLIEQARKEWEAALVHELSLNGLDTSSEGGVKVLDQLWQQVLDYIRTYYLDFMRLITKARTNKESLLARHGSDDTDVKLKVGLLVFENLARNNETYVHKLSVEIAMNMLLSLRTSPPPESSERVRESFAGKKLYLDTNILLAAVGLHSDDDYSHLVVEFLVGMQELGFELAVLDITVDEYRYAIERAIEEIREKKPTTGLPTDIAQVYARKSSGITPQLFFSQYLNPIVILKEKKGVEVAVVETDVKFEDIKTDPLYINLNKNLASSEKPRKVLAHDLVLCFHVLKQNKNVRKGPYFYAEARSYLCTADHALFLLPYQEILNPTQLWLIFGRFAWRVKDYPGLAIGLLNRELVSGFYVYARQALQIVQKLLSVSLKDNDTEYRHEIAGLLAESEDAIQFVAAAYTEESNAVDKFREDIEELIDLGYRVERDNYEGKLSKIVEDYNNQINAQKRKDSLRRVRKLARELNNNVDTLNKTLSSLETRLRHIRPFSASCISIGFKAKSAKLLLMLLGLVFLVFLATYVPFYTWRSISSQYFLQKHLSWLAVYFTMLTTIFSIAGNLYVRTCKSVTKAFYGKDHASIKKTLAIKNHQLRRLKRCENLLKSQESL